MYTLELKVVLTFDDTGPVDAEYLTDSVWWAIERFHNEGELTPDNEAHAMLTHFEVFGPYVEVKP